MTLQTAFQTAAPLPLPLITGSLPSLATLPSLGGPVAGPAKDKPADLGAIKDAAVQRQSDAKEVNAQATAGIKKLQAQSGAPGNSGGGGLGSMIAAAATPFFPAASTTMAIAGLAADFAVSSFPTYSSRGPGDSKSGRKAKNDEAGVFQTSSTNTPATSASMQVNRTIDLDNFAFASAKMAGGRAGISDNVSTFGGTGSTRSYGDYALAGDGLRGISTIASFKTAQLASAKILKDEVPQLFGRVAEREATGLKITPANLDAVADRGPPIRQTASNSFVKFGV